MASVAPIMAESRKASKKRTKPGVKRVEICSVRKVPASADSMGDVHPFRFALDGSGQ